MIDRCFGQTRRGMCKRKPLTDYGYCRQHLNDRLNQLRPQPEIGWLIAESGCDPRYRLDVNMKLVEDFEATLSPQEQHYFAARGQQAGYALQRFVEEGEHRSRPLVATEAWDSMILQSKGFNLETAIKDANDALILSYKRTASSYAKSLMPVARFQDNSAGLANALSESGMGSEILTDSEYQAMLNRQTDYNVAIAEWQSGLNEVNQKLQQAAQRKRDAYYKSNPPPAPPKF